MSGTTDEVKGRIKEAAGALTDNKKLRDDGKTDQVVGKIKQADEARKAVNDAKADGAKAVDNAEADAKKATDKAKDAVKSCSTECD
jgi:uncharacterized protein YjbJ (UPF0337 family)